MRSVGRLVLVIVCLALAGRSAPANAQSACVSAKLEALVKEERGLLSCLAVEAAKGSATTFGKCIRKVAIKFSHAFAKAGSCEEERLECECLAETCAIAVREALPDVGPSKCESARLRTAGKLALRKVRCSSRAAKTGVTVDPACLDRTATRFHAVFARTGAHCTGDEAAVETIVNEQCVSALGADPVGGGTIGELCTSHACDGVD